MELKYLKMNYEDLSLSDEPIKKERALCRKGFVNAMGAREIAEQVLGPLTVADSFHYLYHRFGRPTADTTNEYKISFEYVLKYKGCYFTIHGSTPEFVYIDCFIPKRYERLQHRRYVDEARKIFVRALEADVLLFPYNFYQAEVLTRYQKKKWNVLFDQKAQEYFDADTYAMLDKVDWKSLGEEQRNELHKKYMEPFSKHLCQQFREWEDGDTKRLFGMPSLCLLPEVEQIVGEFCEHLLAPFPIRDCEINIQGWTSPTGTIRLSWEDYSFLKTLQHELNTQENDGNADPVYWGVMETREEAVPDGCGTTQIVYDDGALTLKEAIDKIESEIGEYNEETQIAWDDVQRNDIEAVARFMDEVLKWKCISTVDFQEIDRLSRDTGAFLTKRACQEYISKFGYNHSQPRTYAMTAYRNFELEKLLKILRNMDFK